MRLSFCVACGRRRFLRHHKLIPESRGGRNIEANMITLCFRCSLNSREREYTDRDLLRLGRKAAMERGVKFGRKRKLSTDQVLSALARRAKGERLGAIAKDLGVNISTISRLHSSAMGH
jgi:hypothetical protein